MSELDARTAEFRLRNKKRIIEQIQKLMRRHGITTSDLQVYTVETLSNKLVKHRNVSKHKEKALEGLKKAREVRASKRVSKGEKSNG